jgi:hypothetical protein
MKWVTIGIIVVLCILYYLYTRREHMTNEQLVKTLDVFAKDHENHPQGIANPPAPIESIMNTAAHIKS